ncbi:MAG: hypothetical protein DRJ42_14865 [Deltaproteobacteria bacterium]|nr:MAG: hypothetical protein DRJ42_14865 [Deltaproteobacteria bacterium]
MISTRIPNAFLVLCLVVASLAAYEAPAAAQTSNALFVAAPSLSRSLRRAVPEVLAWESQLVDGRAYTRAARGQGLDAARGPALRRFGPRQGADVIIVAGASTRGHTRLLHLSYYHGQTGEELRAGTYRLRGQKIQRTVHAAIARDLQNAVNLSRQGSRSARAPMVADRQPVDDDAATAEAVAEVATDRGRADEDQAMAGEGENGEENEEGAEAESGPSAVHEAWEWSFDLTAGFGFGQRASTVPMEGGDAHFSSSPFPAVHAAFDVWLRPQAESSLRVGFGTRYYTSVGLQTADLLEDGTTRTVDTRAQNLSLGFKLNFPFTDGPRAVRMDVEAGWSFRMLDSEFQLSMPTYTLSGLYGRSGLLFPIGDESPFALGLAAELGYINSVSEEVAVAGAVSGGVRVGIEVQVRYDIIADLDVSIAYRGSHVFLPSERGGAMSDVERFGVVRVTYRP